MPLPAPLFPPCVQWAPLTWFYWLYLVLQWNFDLVGIDLDQKFLHLPTCQHYGLKRTKPWHSIQCGCRYVCGVNCTSLLHLMMPEGQQPDVEVSLCIWAMRRPSRWGIGGNASPHKSGLILMSFEDLLHPPFLPPPSPPPLFFGLMLGQKFFLSTKYGEESAAVLYLIYFFFETLLHPSCDQLKLSSRKETNLLLGNLQKKGVCCSNI